MKINTIDGVPDSSGFVNRREHAARIQTTR
jgi:hypothetical protein